MRVKCDRCDAVVAHQETLTEENQKLKQAVELMRGALALARPFVENTNSIVVGQKAAYLAVKSALATVDELLKEK